MATFSFRDLNLSNVQASSGAGAMAPGRYKMKVSDAEWKTTRAGGHQVALKLKDTVSGGMVNDFINVHVPSSEQATQIGLERLKAVCVHGGHPDPDNVGTHGIASLKGLTLGVAVRESEYEKNGEKRKGAEVHYYFDPAELSGSSGVISSKSDGGDNADLDDDIPF